MPAGLEQQKLLHCLMDVFLEERLERGGQLRLHAGALELQGYAQCRIFVGIEAQLNPGSFGAAFFAGKRCYEGVRAS